MTWAPGEIVGPYRIIDQVGQGGMAAVYKAYHAALDRYVAIKVLNPAIKEDPHFLSRFQREARIVAKLDHPNIIPIHDFAVHEGTPYLVMRYVEGKSLKAILRGEPLPPNQVLAIIHPIINALAYAHSRGVLHRDIKPSNIMLADNGQIYLADFGLARIVQATTSTMSQDTFVGTPQYISPEQAKGENTDERTDVYALGIVLYEMLTGRVPFNADTPYAVIHDQIFSPPPLPSSLNREVTHDLETVLLKALAKEPTERYSNTTYLLLALERALGISSVIPRPLNTASPKKFRWNVHPAILIGVGVLLLIGLLFIFGGRFGAPVVGTTPVASATVSNQPVAMATSIRPTDAQPSAPSPTLALTSVPTSIPTNTRTLVPTLTPTITRTPTPSAPPNMVLVPASVFWMGESPQDGQAAPNEKPGHYVDQNAFAIDKFEISNAEYKQCVTAGVCEPPRGVYSPQSPNLAYGNPAFDNSPVVFVTHGMAARYCTWVGKRLPYEAEWEKAARGNDQPRIYPWGNTWEGGRVNAAQGNPGVLPIDSYTPQGCSPYGACNMIGNVAEWIADNYSPTFYADSIRDLVSPNLVRNPINVGTGAGNYVIRGGSFKSNLFDSRISKRFVRGAEESVDDVGFRCAK